MPQEICYWWKSNGGRGYERNYESDCQYKGVLISGLVGIALGYCEVVAQWRARLESIGIDDKGLGRGLVAH